MSLYEDNFPFIKGSLWTGALFVKNWAIGESCTWRPPSLTWSIGCCCRCHNAALHTHKGAFTYFGLLSHSPFLLNPNKPQTSFFDWLCFESGINMILTNINSVLFYTVSGWFWIANTQFHCKYETSWKQIGNIKVIPNICLSYSAFWSFVRKKIVWKYVQTCSSLLNRSEMTDHIAFLLTQRITGSKRVTQLS